MRQYGVVWVHTGFKSLTDGRRINTYEEYIKALERRGEIRKQIQTDMKKYNNKIDIVYGV